MQIKKNPNEIQSVGNEKIYKKPNPENKIDSNLLEPWLIENRIKKLDLNG